MSHSLPVQSYLSYSLATAHRQVHGSLSKRLKEFNVQVEAWRVMEVLEAGSNLTMGDLAEAVLMNPPTLTKLVDRMVSDGIVHRRMASIDQRQVNLILTDLGKKRVQQIREQARLEDDAILNKLGSEKADLLHRILGELVQ